MPGHHCTRAFSSCGEWELLSSCGAGASCCHGFSRCGARAVGHAGFSIVVGRFSCPVACGIFQDQGPKPCPPAWQGGFLTTGAPGKPSNRVILLSRGYLVMSGHCFLVMPWTAGAGILQAEV